MHLGYCALLDMYRGVEVVACLGQYIVIHYNALLRGFIDFVEWINAFLFFTISDDSKRTTTSTKNQCLRSL